MKNTFIYKALSISCLFVFCSGCVKGIEYENVSYEDPRVVTLMNEMWEHGIEKHSGEKYSYQYNRDSILKYFEDGTRLIGTEQYFESHTVDINTDKLIIHANTHFEILLTDVDNRKQTYKNDFDTYFFLKDDKAYQYQDGSYYDNEVKLTEYTSYNNNGFSLESFIGLVESKFLYFEITYGDTSGLFSYSDLSKAFIYTGEPTLNSSEFKLAKNRNGYMKFSLSADEGDLDFKDECRGTEVFVDANIEDFLIQKFTEDINYYFLSNYSSFTGTYSVRDCPCVSSDNHEVIKLKKFTNFKIPKISDDIIKTYVKL